MARETGNGRRVAGGAFFLDTDAMTEDSATKVASQQSIKAYVDARTGVTELVAVTNLPAANSVSITSIAQTYASLVLTITGVSSDTATRYLLVRLDTDNGASYDATGTNYIGMGSDTTSVQTNTDASIAGGAGGVSTAAQTADLCIVITGYQAGSFTKAVSSGNRAAAVHTSGNITHKNVGAIDAIQIIWNDTGDFDAGTYSLHGFN